MKIKSEKIFNKLHHKMLYFVLSLKFFVDIIFRVMLFDMISKQPCVPKFLLATIVLANVILYLFMDILDMCIEIKFAIESNPAKSANVVPYPTVDGHVTFQGICVVEFFLKSFKIINWLFLLNYWPTSQSSHSYLSRFLCLKLWAYRARCDGNSLSHVSHFSRMFVWMEVRWSLNSCLQ